jgi:hypothetical protein
LCYLFYNLPLHVDQQQGGYAVGSMAKRISHKPLREEALASESELPAEQTVEAGEVVHEAVLARTDASSSLCSIHEADDTCVFGNGSPTPETWSNET